MNELNPKKAELLELLPKLCELYPEWRFGQMVANLSFWSKGPTPQAIWDVEDEELIQTIKAHLQKQQPPQPPTP